MNQVLNPSNELKEKALARIPKACRNTFYRVNPDGSSEKIESVFDLKKGDRFFIMNRHLEMGLYKKKIFIAISNPYINSQGMPTIYIKKVINPRLLCSSNTNG